ncbi:MAG TPA: low molecular weight protein arginine phosphatase [Gemmatimonadales bacterium]|nr:low molecular weight protein arginine phosphatase [Gemmatimonadales bacterium]
MHGGGPPAGPGGCHPSRRAAARRREPGTLTASPSRVVLVCTGNTCRSALAEALLRQALAAHGLADLPVVSAGTGAWEGAPASEGAYLVALEEGLDLSGHRARLLTAESIGPADLVLTMARHHRARVLELIPDARAHLLGEYAGRTAAAAEVADPFGGDLEGYRQTLTDLKALTAAVAARLAGKDPDAGR